MVDAVFLKILEMSVMGSVVILITILARFLLRNRSKSFIMILWAAVALRMLVPVGIESELSIFNLLPVQTQSLIAAAQGPETSLPDNVDTIEVSINDVVDITHVETQSNAVTVNPSETDAAVVTLPDIKTIAAMVWLTGVVGIIAYCAIRFIGLKIKLRDAKKTDKNIYVSGRITSPFVFGLFVPKMYLPDTLEDIEREYVLAHESTHIKHGDWLKKMAGMAVVAVHWFNPLAWLAFVLFEQDIEMSCDETTISNLDASLRKSYVMSIVSYARKSNNKRYLVTPLGFSRNAFCKAEVTNRVMNIVNFKKGTKLTSIAITASMLALAAACSLNSKPAEETTVTDVPAAEQETEESVQVESESDTLVMSLRIETVDINDGEGMKVVPSINGNTIDLPVTVSELKDMGFRYNGHCTDKSFEMEYVVDGKVINMIQCYAGEDFNPDNGPSDSLTVTSIQIDAIYFSDYYGDKAVITSEEIDGQSGPFSSIVVTHDGQSLVVYCYDENDNPVEIDSFPAYEIIVSDSDVEVNLVDG
jgi:beta-lactamase regulating signal transducer with metallopeptidase domain